MKTYKTYQFNVDIATDYLELSKKFKAELEEKLEKPDRDFPEICGGFHGVLECMIHGMERFLETLQEVSENEHV